MDQINTNNNNKQRLHTVGRTNITTCDQSDCVCVKHISESLTVLRNYIKPLHIIVLVPFVTWRSRQVKQFENYTG